jgi:carbonic anhydrase/acetyltransferase-like protein (isoleucine patch superfamily)
LASAPNPGYRGVVLPTLTLPQMALLSIRRLVLAETPFGRTARALRRAVLNFTLPAPLAILRPILYIFLVLRQAYYFLFRVFIAEPLFKASCATVGRNVRTGPFVQWVQGAGRMEIGDDVALHGKCSFIFASRYADEPFFSIGSHTHIGHNCSFVIGRSVIIGEHCQIAPDVVIFDASGHPSDPLARERGEAAPLDSVKPVVIERNVWIGRGATIFPGVSIGQNSVISTGAVVMNSVPPNSLMMGNPARRIATV